ncbi:hypothetical protein ACFL6S_26875 [Candidatus Poribacteria bacterium]
MKIHIPDLLKIRPTRQRDYQIRDFTIDLGVNSFLRVVFGGSRASAASLPGSRNLRSLLQNPYSEKEVIRSRQDMFNEIFQRSLEDSLDSIAGRLTFCATAIRQYPNESSSQYLMREERELRSSREP